MLHRNTCILNCSAVVPDNLANVNVSFNTSVHHQSRDPSSCHFEFASWIYTSEWFSSDKPNVKLQNKGAYTSKCKTSTQQVQHWSRCDDMGTKTNRQTRWYKGEKNKKKTVARHDKTASSIRSQSEHINKRDNTLCHALVSVRQSTHMQAVLLSLSLSLLPCKHCLFLIFQFLGLHDNKIIPCRKHWSGSEGNTKGSAHKASQCSQCTLLRRQTASSSQQLYSHHFGYRFESFHFKSTPLSFNSYCGFFFLSSFFVSLCFNKWSFLKQRSNKRKERAHQPSRSSEGWKGVDAEHNDVRGERENGETQRE